MVVVEAVAELVVELVVKPVVELLDMALVGLRLPQSRRRMAAVSRSMSPTGRPRR